MDKYSKIRKVVNSRNESCKKEWSLLQDFCRFHQHELRLFKTIKNEIYARNV